MGEEVVPGSDVAVAVAEEADVASVMLETLTSSTSVGLALTGLSG